MEMTRLAIWKMCNQQQQQNGNGMPDMHRPIPGLPGLPHLPPLPHELLAAQQKEALHLATRERAQESEVSSPLKRPHKEEEEEEDKENHRDSSEERLTIEESEERSEEQRVNRDVRVERSVSPPGAKRFCAERDEVRVDGDDEEVEEARSDAGRSDEQVEVHAAAKKPKITTTTTTMPGANIKITSRGSIKVVFFNWSIVSF